MKFMDMGIEGYEVREFGKPVKRYCQMLDLKEDEDLVAEYIKLHSAAEHRKEIRDGIRAVGILEMEIYVKDNHLFMIVETGLDFDWEKAMDELSKQPGQAEWEQLVDKYQKCDPGTSCSQKWSLMDRIFFLYDDK